MEIDLNLVKEQIVPIFKTSKDTSDIKSYIYLGTGFIFTNNLLLTCWHCVNDINLKENEQVSAIVVKPDGADHLVYELVIDQDLNKTDIAICGHKHILVNNIVNLPKYPDYNVGTTVWTYGYPETRLKDKNTVLIPGQFFKGYITRNLYFDSISGNEKIPSYEINISFPKGLSGAPLFTESCEFIGIVYGTNDVARIEEYSESMIEGAKATKIVEVRRIISYGLAHHTSVILNIETNFLKDRKKLFVLE